MIRHTRASPAYPSIFATSLFRRRWMAGSSPAMTRESQVARMNPIDENKTAGCSPAVRTNQCPKRSAGSRNPLLQLCLRRGANLARGHFAAFEDHQSRDRHHAVFGSRLRAFIDVQLHDLDLVAHGAGNLVKRGRDHAAGAAPFGPEIDHDRADRLEHFGVEIGVRNLANGHWDTSFGWEDAAERIAASIMHSTYERMVAGSSLVIPLDNGCQLRVQRRSRNLHQFRGFSPK